MAEVVMMVKKPKLDEPVVHYVFLEDTDTKTKIKALRQNKFIKNHTTEEQLYNFLKSHILMLEDYVLYIEEVQCI